MSNWTVKYTNMAFAELDAIYRYIAVNLQAPETSVGQIRRIMSAISALDDMPMRNPLYDNEPWRSYGLRKMPVDNYVVFYFTEEQTNEVVIAHVFYGGQNIADILREEAKRSDS